MQSLLEKMTSYVGIVCNPDGPIGSGVFIESKKSEMLLMTSRHVIIPAVLGGWTTINYLEDKTFTFAPDSVRIAPDLDIGYLSLPQDKNAKNFFTTSHLNITNQAPLRVGESIYFSGIPYCSLGGLNNLTNSVDEIFLLNAEASVQQIQENVIACLLSETVLNDLESKGITSLAGCSGGPVFSSSMNLVGILKAQTITQSGKLDGIHFVPATQIPYLVDSEGIPDGELFNDYIMTEMGYRFHLNVVKNNSIQTFECDLIFEHWQSSNNFSKKYGDFYRTRTLVLGRGTTMENFSINVTTIAYRMDDLKSNSLNLWEEVNRVLGYPKLRVQGYELAPLKSS